MWHILPNFSSKFTKVIDTANLTGYDDNDNELTWPAWPISICLSESKYLNRRHFRNRRSQTILPSPPEALTRKDPYACYSKGDIDTRFLRKDREELVRIVPMQLK